jgi:hypothetical protein
LLSPKNAGVPFALGAELWQKVERPTNKSFYINFPAALAEAAEIEKGEDFEWLTEDRNTFLLKRVRKAKSFIAKKKKD